MLNRRFIAIVAGVIMVYLGINAFAQPSADTTPPTITLIGSAEMTINVGTNFVDPGATAQDDVDGDLTSEIVVTGSVDEDIPGVYQLRYNVSDKARNAAEEVVRTVNVVQPEVEEPIIMLNSDNPLIVNVGSTYTDPFGTVLVDGEVIATLTLENRTGELDTNRLGTYLLYYNYPGALEVIRVVRVVDRTAPVITLLGDAVVNHEAGTPYTDAEATALDNYYGDLTANIVVNNPVDTSKLGTYTITYNVIDGSGNSAAEVTRIVTVQDTIDPVIQGVEDGHYYNTDVTITIVEENIASVTVNDVEITLDSNKQYTFTENGQYRVVVTDEANHQATVSFIIDKNAPKNPIVTPKKRQTIEVLQPFDINSIVVSFYDKEENTYYFGERYLIEYRVDNKAKFGAVDSLDTAKAGEYKIHYRASDMAGNEATTVAYVDVVVPNGTVYNETQKKTYNGLNKAINNANPGDKILIGPGKYQNYFVIDKDGLTLKGFGKKEDIIIMSNKNGCFEITTNNVTLENLTIKASKNYTSAPVIHLIGANDVNIINNIVEANYTKTGQPAIGTSSGPARATGLIKGNTVTGAIGVGTAGNLEVSNNTILNAYSEGIWFYPIEPTAELIIKNNKVMNHAYGDSTAKQLKVTSRPASINGKTTDDKIYKNILNNNKITTVKFDWITYDNIQAAIDAANINDKIIVAPGVYNEHLTINKEGIKLVSLLGTSETIINGTITIHTVDNVLVEGFTVIAPVDYKATPVIHMIDADNVTILDNIVEANYQLTGQPAIGTSTGPARVTGLIKGNTVTGAIGVGTDGKLEIINNTILNAYSEGIWFGPITSTAELTIRNNKILNWAAIEPTAKKIKIVSKPASINGKKDDDKMLNAIVNSNKDITDTDVNFVWLAP